VALSRSSVRLLNDAISIYMDECRAKGMAQNTLETKARSLSRFADWCKLSGYRKLSEFDIEVFESYREYLHFYRKTIDGQPLALNSIYKFLTDLKLLFKGLYKRGIISVTEIDKFDLPRCQKRIPRDVLSVDEIQRILHQPDIRGGVYMVRDRAILELLYASAVRRSELAKLELSDINITRKTLRIVNSKGYKDRVIPVYAEAIEWVSEYVQGDRMRVCSPGSGDLFFLDKVGKPATRDQIGQTVGRYVRRAGIDKPGACHLFRHRVATLMLENGADIRFIQHFLGHADISTTQIYTHVAIRKLEEVYNKSHPAI